MGHPIQRASNPDLMKIKKKKKSNEYLEDTGNDQFLEEKWNDEMLEEIHYKNVKDLDGASHPGSIPSRLNEN